MKIYEVWRPAAPGGMTMLSSHRQRWRARLAAWWWRASVPRDSYLRQTEIRARSG